jgi:putative ABC transport system permease protein
LLPPGVLLETPQAAADEAANLSRAYRVNLTMLAAMALLTGGFLVFSAQALSVVRRRSEFAFLRAIGLSRASLFRWLLAEGALIGLLGGVLGAAARSLAWPGRCWRCSAATSAPAISPACSRSLQFQPAAIGVYVGLGVVAGMAGAWLPAREAARLRRRRR